MNPEQKTSDIRRTPHTFNIHFIIFLGVQIQRSSGPNPMGIPHQLLRGNSQGGVGPCLDGAPASGDRSFTGGNFDDFFHPIHPSSGKLFVSPHCGKK